MLTVILPSVIVKIFDSCELRHSLCDFGTLRCPACEKYWGFAALEPWVCVEDRLRAAVPWPEGLLQDGDRKSVV